jgi:hypothetical protein
MKMLGVTLFTLMLATTSYAATQTVGERNALSISRLSLAAGAGYEWTSSSGVQTVPYRPKKEWVIGLFSAYNLTPGVSGYGRTSVIASIQYPTDTKLTRTQVGVRVTLFQGE